MVRHETAAHPNASEALTKLKRQRPTQWPSLDGLKTSISHMSSAVPGVARLPCRRCLPIYAGNNGRKGKGRRKGGETATFGGGGGGGGSKALLRLRQDYFSTTVNEKANSTHSFPFYQFSPQSSSPSSFSPCVLPLGGGGGHTLLHSVVVLRTWLCALVVTVPW